MLRLFTMAAGKNQLTHTTFQKIVPSGVIFTPVCAPPTNDPVELALVWASLGKSGNRLERSTGDIFADRDETRHICRAVEEGDGRKRGGQECKSLPGFEEGESVCLMVKFLTSKTNSDFKSQTQKSWKVQRVQF